MTDPEGTQPAPQRLNSTSGLVTADYYPTVDDLLRADGTETFGKLTGKLKKDSILCLLREAVTQLREAKYNQNSCTHAVDAGEDADKRLDVIEKKLDVVVEKLEKTDPQLPRIKVSSVSSPELLEKLDEIRIQGIPESSANSANKRFEDDGKSVTDILEYLEANSSTGIQEVFRVGKPNTDPNKPRPVIIKFNSVWSTRKILSKSYNLKEYCDAVYISKSLTKAGQELERQLLKRRRELIEGGYDRKQIKIRDLKLYLDDELQQLEPKQN